MTHSKSRSPITDLVWSCLSLIHQIPIKLWIKPSSGFWCREHASPGCCAVYPSKNCFCVVLRLLQNTWHAMSSSGHRHGTWSQEVPEYHWLLVYLPPEKYDFVSWDGEILNWMEKSSKCSKPPTRSWMTHEWRGSTADFAASSSIWCHSKVLFSNEGMFSKTKQIKMRYLWTMEQKEMTNHRYQLMVYRIHLYDEFGDGVLLLYKVYLRILTLVWKSSLGWN